MRRYSSVTSPSHPAWNTSGNSRTCVAAMGITSKRTGSVSTKSVNFFNSFMSLAAAEAESGKRQKKRNNAAFILIVASILRDACGYAKPSESRAQGNGRIIDVARRRSDRGKIIVRLNVCAFTRNCTFGVARKIMSAPKNVRALQRRIRYAGKSSDRVFRRSGTLKTSSAIAKYQWTPKDPAAKS